MIEDEVLRREAVALAAIKRSFGTEEAEYGANLYVSHHLEELSAEYWQKHLGTKTPEGVQILDLLKLHSHWSNEDENGIDVFDFTLPDRVSNYLMSVRFNEGGDVDDISMES